MKANLKIVRGGDKFFAVADGENVTLSRQEVKLSGEKDGCDLWAPVGVETRRRIAVPVAELSWLGDGQPVSYSLITV